DPHLDANLGSNQRKNAAIKAFHIQRLLLGGIIVAVVSSPFILPSNSHFIGYRTITVSSMLLATFLIYLIYKALLLKKRTLLALRKSILVIVMLCLVYHSYGNIYATTLYHKMEMDFINKETLKLAKQGLGRFIIIRRYSDNIIPQKTIAMHFNWRNPLRICYDDASRTRRCTLPFEFSHSASLALPGWFDERHLITKIGLILRNIDYEKPLQIFVLHPQDPGGSAELKNSPPRPEEKMLLPPTHFSPGVIQVDFNG
ncbi:MAG: hypothetical protein HQL53_14985, partial [Magnetococcales bacterium]|nr:hypothetical protein [Magnetococcales bacterium]